MVDTFFKQISNVILAVAIGYMVNLGITFDSAYELFSNPLDNDWNATAHALFATIDQIRQDLTPFVEGPAQDFAGGLREAVIERMKDAHGPGKTLLAQY